jgi:hypothetical protein
MFQCNHGYYSTLDQFSAILQVFGSLVSNKNVEAIISMVSYNMIWVCWDNHHFYAPTVKDETNFKKIVSFLQFKTSVSTTQLSLDLISSANRNKPSDKPFERFIINRIRSISFSTTSTTTKVKEYDNTIQHDQHTDSCMIQVSILRRMHEDMNHPQYGRERNINVLLWFQMQIQISFRQYSTYSLWPLSFAHHHHNKEVNW